MRQHVHYSHNKNTRQISYINQSSAFGVYVDKLCIQDFVLIHDLQNVVWVYIPQDPPFPVKSQMSLYSSTYSVPALAFASLYGIDVNG